MIKKKCSTLIFLCIMTVIGSNTVVFSQDNLFLRTITESDLSDEEFQEAKQIVRQAEMFRGNDLEDFMYRMRVVHTVDGASKSDSLLRVFVTQKNDGSERSALIKIDEGSSKGNIILQKDINMWFYKPGTSKSLRISASQRLVGGASYADISSTNYTVHYDPVSIEAETVGNTEAYKITLKKIKKGVFYDRIDLFVAQNDKRPIKGDFFTVSGRLLKTLYFRKFKPLRIGSNTYTISTEWIITDSLHKNNITYIVVEGMEAQKLDAIEYTQEGMRK